MGNAWLPMPALRWWSPRSLGGSSGGLLPLLPLLPAGVWRPSLQAGEVENADRPVGAMAPKWEVWAARGPASAQ